MSVIPSYSYLSELFFKIQKISKKRFLYAKNNKTGKKNYKTVKLQYLKIQTIEKKIMDIFVFSDLELVKKCLFGPGYFFSVL